MTNDLITELIEIIKKECPTIVDRANTDPNQAPPFLTQLHKAGTFLAAILPMVKVVIENNARLEEMNKRLSDALTEAVELQPKYDSLMEASRAPYPFVAFVPKSGPSGSEGC